MSDSSRSVVPAFDVISIGEPLWEMSALPEEHGKYTLGYGGDTLNFCVAAARQGAKAAYLTRLGKDLFGDDLAAIMAREQVDVAHVSRDERASTGGYFIHHGPKGHTFSYARSGSAASKLSPDDIDDALILGTRFVHGSGITQAISASARAATLKLLTRARTLGVATAFDSNLRLRLWPVEEARVALAEALAVTDYFFPSLEDAEALSGETDHQTIINWAHGLGARTVLLKLGPDGVKISQAAGETVTHLPGFKVKTVDATGAGDCFAGSTIARLAAGDDVVTAARYGCAAAALTTTAYGAIGAIPARDRVTAFLQAQ